MGGISNLFGDNVPNYTEASIICQEKQCSFSVRILSWLVPKSIKKVREIFELAGYYRRFIKWYGVISKPLTNLLKKINFGWNEESTEAFEKSKNTIVSTPLLAVPNFNEGFIIEIDVSDQRMGVVLLQAGSPITFMS